MRYKLYYSQLTVHNDSAANVIFSSYYAIVKMTLILMHRNSTLNRTKLACVFVRRTVSSSDIRNEFTIVFIYVDIFGSSCMLDGHDELFVAAKKEAWMRFEAGSFSVKEKHLNSIQHTKPVP